LLLLLLPQSDFQISLTATGGCGNPLAPAGIQVDVCLSTLVKNLS
jgi:hypothetical protein